MDDLSIIILTYNEEKNLPKCLASIQAFNCPVFVVDSGSTDNTLTICEEHGVIVNHHKFETHTKQWEYALSSLPFKTEWILGIDADQEMLPELVNEIKEMLTSDPSVDGFYINRRNYFMGKWIRYGGYYPRYLLKLFRKDKIFMDSGELMEHHFYVNGKTARLKHDMVENNLNENLGSWSLKHDRYTSLMSEEVVNNTSSLKGSLVGNQDERRVVLKNTWNKMPLFFRSTLYFLYRYFILLGFLDGKTGLIFHFLQGFWFRFLIDAKIYELRKK